MKTLAELLATAEKMQAFLETPASNDEEKIIERMELLQVLIAKSGNYLADAKFLQDSETQRACMQVLEDGTFYGQSTTFINKFINAAGKDFNRIVTWLDRINSAAAKQHAGLITVLSYRKEQMKMI
jgi:hypothetical protein